MISKLILQAGNKTMRNKLVEAYKSLGEAELRILEEWELASSEIEQDRRGNKN